MPSLYKILPGPKPINPGFLPWENREGLQGLIPFFEVTYPCHWTPSFWPKEVLSRVLFRHALFEPLFSFFGAQDDYLDFAYSLALVPFLFEEGRWYTPSIIIIIILST